MSLSRYAPDTLRLKKSIRLNQKVNPRPDKVSGKADQKDTPVSYTHLDVYKRQMSFYV